MPKETRHPLEWVSHRNREGRAIVGTDRFLTSENHALYFGKVRRLLWKDRVRRLMGWGEVKEGLYNEDSVIGVLDYLFQHAKPDEYVSVRVCSELSRIFNGKEDMEGHLTPEEEIEWIYGLAQERFKKPREALEVVDLAKLPEHHALFEALREHKGNLWRLFAPSDEWRVQREDDSGSVSLELLEKFWKTYQASAAFKTAIHQTLPRSFANLEPEEQERLAGYALTEVAIRLSEVLTGRFIHAGMDRQSLYDAVIAQVLRGKLGKFDLGEQPFETLRLKPRENVYAVRAGRNRARARLAIYAAGVLSAATGIYAKGRYDEAAEQAEIEAKMDEWLATELKDVTFYLDGPLIELPKDGNVEQFHRIVREMEEELLLRYNLPYARLREITPFMEKWLLDHKYRLSDMHNHPSTVQDNVDIFTQEHRGYFLGKGIRIDRPYPQLEPYDELLNEVLVSSGPPWEPTGSAWENRGPYSIPDGIGELRGSRGEQFYLYEWNLAGKVYLLGESGYGSRDPLHRSYSHRTAQRAAWFYRHARERFAAAPFRYHLNEFPTHNNGLPKDLMLDPSQSSPYYDYETLPDYVDPSGQFHFELILCHHYNSELNVVEKVVLARRPGETFYTAKTAEQVGELVDSVIFPRPNPHFP